MFVSGHFTVRSVPLLAPGHSVRPTSYVQQIVMKRRENEETWGDVTKQDYNSLFHFSTCMMLIHWIVRCSPGHFILRSIVIAC